MDNVIYNSKLNWKLNEIVYPADSNRWEKGIADVVALANYLNTTDIPQLRAAISNLQNNVANKDLSNLTVDASQRLVPVGALMMGPVNTMAGFLLCNGQAVSRTEYAALYSLIGTSFGSGDGSTTFNVPDYRGCFLRGLGGDSAASMYTKQPMGLPNHDHIMHGKGTIDNSYITNTSKSWSGGGGGNFGAGSNPNTSIRTGDASESNSVYGAASEVRPVNYAVNYFIKY